MLTDKVKSKIQKHALEDPENEVCGLIIKTLRGFQVIKCKNIAPDSDVHFIISNVEVEKTRKSEEIVGVYHSHCKTKDILEDGLSEEDKIVSEYFNIAYVLYSLITERFYEYSPTGIEVPLGGRPFISKLLDDVELVKDYYNRKLNIKTDKLKNRTNFELFLRDNEFYETGGLRIHDIVLLNWQGNKLKPKLGIFVGNNKILVHPDFDKSRITTYNYGMKKWTNKIFRHQKMD